MRKYVVIGGQYEPHYYGTFNSVKEAKRVADSHEEYWDNWNGFHVPKIYNYDDTEPYVTKGWITYYDGTEIRIPKAFVSPAYVRNYESKWQKW